MGYSFEFCDWFELLTLRKHIKARAVEYAEVRGVWDYQRRLSDISTSQTTKGSGPTQEMMKGFKETGKTLKEQSDSIERDLLEICDHQIQCILNQVAEETDFNQEQNITTKSCFFPGKEIEFFHDPNEIFIKADLPIPLIRRPGYEESIPESADGPLDDGYYVDGSNKASGDEDDDDESGSGTAKQKGTWWSSSALRKLNEDCHKLASTTRQQQETQ
ncbi:MAG: hypothetical protein LQ350_002688 [Teloschistes chrysophthalmus]|nr:MAG: hypothetical protein LQ350_002688 [Niorma chrysophthalma]